MPWRMEYITNWEPALYAECYTTDRRLNRLTFFDRCVGVGRKRWLGSRNGREVYNKITLREKLLYLEYKLKQVKHTERIENDDEHTDKVAHTTGSA